MPPKKLKTQAQVAKALKKLAKKKGKKKKNPTVSLLSWGKSKVLGPLRLKGARSADVVMKSMRDSKPISAPVVKQRNYSIGAPQFNGGKPMIVRHREYLQPITTVQAFTGAGRYIIQPGLVDNFPWLSQIAGAYENYIFKDIRYVYRNRCATNTNITVYTATQYDVTDPEFKSIDEIMTYKGARSEVAWRDFSVDCKVRGSGGQIPKKYLVRTDVVTSDLHLYDSALFTICAVSTQATVGTYAGDLLVEYTVEFWNPKMNPAILGAMGIWAAPLFSSVATWAAGPLVGVNASVTSNSSNYFSDVAKPVIDEGKSEITFPVPGAYDVAYTADLATGGGTGVASVDYYNTDGKSVTKGWSASVGSFPTLWVKIITTVAGAVLKIVPLTPSGTTSNFRANLVIAVEALNILSSFVTDSPMPSQTRLHLENFKKAHPRHDVSKWEAMLRDREWKQELKEQLNLRIKEGPLESKLRKPAEEENQRYQNQSRAEDSDGDIVEPGESVPAVTPATPLKDPWRSGSKSRK